MLRRVFCKLLLVAIVLLWAFAGVLLAQGRSAEGLARAIAAQEKHTERLMDILDVEGTAVGLDENDQFVVKVYTARPGVNGIPANLEKVPVQVEVTGKFVARQKTTDMWPTPVPIGVSTGNEGQCSAGTIGCRVKDDSGNVYALSNNHVYALESNADSDSLVLQPGLYDTQCVFIPSETVNVIGMLYDYVPIVFHPRANNKVDAAIASTTVADVANYTPGSGGYTPSATTVQAYIGQSVKKYGRTTGLTFGQVDAINATVRVQYSSGKAQFVEQIVIIPGTFSDSGDSGSLIVTNDSASNPVGLLFAGSSSATIANPIDYVLGAFNVTVDDGSGDDTTNNPPTADFSYTATYLAVEFTDQSTDSDGTIASWSWDFGDGETSTAQNPSRTYATDGTYTVSLTVTDDDGATDTISQDVTVSSGSTGGITLTATGYKIRGRKHTDLEWSGATGTDVEIYRDGALIATTPNDGFHTDATNSVGGGSFTYKVCEIGGSPCSNEVTVYY